jgi:hypothetical protein
MSGMKASTIKTVLRNRIDDWLKTITDETLVADIKKDAIVSGGAIASMLLGETINDYDIYFRTLSTTKAVAEYYVSVFNTLNKDKKITMNGSLPTVMEEDIQNIKGETERRVVIRIKSAGVASETQGEYKYFEGHPEQDTEDFFDSLSNTELISSVEIPDNDPIGTVEVLVTDLKDKTKPKYRPVFLSDNAITMSDKIQLIIRFYGEPDKILNNYDFAHTMNYYDYAKNELHLEPVALESLLSKALVYKGSLYPIASIFRIRKFIERGWRITAGQLLKIIWQITEIDFNKPGVLREQLIGVDQAYMYQLLEALKSKDGKIDSAYIAKLVDEIFE